MPITFGPRTIGPDGELRRTQSDMYFAEVRPFEEIFREGEPPPGGQQQQQQQSQNGQQAEELAELQKEIINATWRVVRDERGNEAVQRVYRKRHVAERVASRCVGASWKSWPGRSRMNSRCSTSMWFASYMQTALIELAKAGNDSDVGPLNPALLAEQGAYGGLLKLRAREFQVTRSQRQQSQSRSSSSQRRRQQQLDELELDQDENRYETQQQAEEASQEEQQQQEIRQVLNRLRELARRQEDLNKELGAIAIGVGRGRNARGKRRDRAATEAVA